MRGYAFSIRSYETPELAAQYLPEPGSATYHVVQRYTAGETTWHIEVRSEEAPVLLVASVWYDRSVDADAEATRLNAEQPSSS